MMIPGTQAGTVTSTTDSGPGALRDILSTAVNNEVIDFAPALNGATITLTTGPLSITGLTLTIDASSLASGITLSGNQHSRILTITKNESTNVIADVTLKNLHLREGRENGDNGGGLYALSSNLALDACSIQHCVSAFDGGGIWANGVTGSIKRCKIAGNQSGSYGGGVFLIGISGTKSLDISSSEVSGNLAQYGGGIYNFWANPTLSNCSIQGNSGSGMRSEASSNPVLRNCIVWGNTMSGGTIADSQLSNIKNINNVTDCHPDVDYSLIAGASDSASFSDVDAVVWGTHNLDGTLAANNPKFVGEVSAASAPNPAADLRFFTGSPCLNVGNNDFAGTSLDLAANARIQDVTIDLGAYEGGYASFTHLYGTLDPAGDANGNSLTNFLEYALGIDPSGPNDASAVPAVASSEGFMWLSFTRRSNGIDIVPLWTTSTSLEPSSWIPMIQGVHYEPESTTPLAPDRQRVVFKLLVSDLARFYRQGFSDGK